MMKVTNTTHGMIAANRRQKNEVMVQRMKKDGTWGKSIPTMRFGKETDQEVVERLIKLNGVQYRIAE